ncbi:MAG: amino acid adenylation domain-containing protein [Candidatus Aenigmarchaeota archaeon]|nr:amino acid adenylation domain-containing protein [Candidatus Aenigmarchaeota archaeon]
MNTYLLHYLLTKSVDRHPEKDAVVFMEKSLTYADLDKRSNQLASALARLGTRKGDRIGIILNKSIESIIALFGILKAGASYVPIDSQIPASRAHYIMRNCEIKCILTSQEIANKVLTNLDADSPLKKVLVSGGAPDELTQQAKTLELISWEEITESESEDCQHAGTTDTYPAYILYTSGSTGTPKGVVISHLNSMAFVNMATDFFKIDEKDRFSSHAPLHFDLSVFDIFVAVKRGATIVLVPQYLSVFPMKLAEYIEEKRISVWNSVSSVLSLLAERGQLENFTFNSLRLVLFSGEILPVKYLRKIKARMPKALFFNLYGQTEANSSLYYQIKEIPSDDAWRIPIGNPFPNFEVFALDENNEMISNPGEEGELFVRGTTVAMGYWDDSERTAASFVPDPFHPYSPNKVYKTGDLVRIDNDGNYVFVGRKDHLVKSRGYRIEINEIEIALNSHPEIKLAAAITIPDDLIGNRIIAYVSSKEGRKLKASEVLNHCGGLIPKYMVPEAIEFLQQLPTTSTGKIDRKLLAHDALVKFAHPNGS